MALANKENIIQKKLYPGTGTPYSDSASINMYIVHMYTRT